MKMLLRLGLLFSFFNVGLSYHSNACTNPKLNSLVSEFRVSQVSRIDALLQFGDVNNLCFGIEYADAALLRYRVDIDIPSGSVEDGIRSIIDKSHRVSLGVVSGVIEVDLRPSDSPRNNIFDHVLPQFQAGRGSLQEISNLLYMDLMVDLNPDITGFAGNYPAGDLKDLIGPFRESKRSLRYLLDTMLFQSKARTWISRLNWKQSEEPEIHDRRYIWTFVEGKSSEQPDYSTELDSIASELAPTGSPN